MELNIVSDRIKAYLDDLSGPSILKTPNRTNSRGEPLQIYNNTWNFSN